MPTKERSNAELAKIFKKAKKRASGFKFESEIKKKNKWTFFK